MACRMGTAMLRASIVVLVMVLAMTLVGTMPAPGQVPRADRQPDFNVTDKGALVEGGDILWGKCSKIPREVFASELPPQAARACEEAGFSVKGSPTQTPMPDTGGPPLILVPIALLVICRLLIRKSTAL
jgi:hypothetical protein